MPFEGIHEVTGYLSLIFLGIALASGAWIILRNYIQALKFLERSLLVKIHKLSSGLFVASLLPHVATTGVIDGYFVLGALLMGLTLSIAFLIPWFPSKRKPIVDFKILVFLIGGLILLIAHLKV